MKCPFGHGDLLSEKIVEIEMDYCPLCGVFSLIRKESEYRVSCPSSSFDMYIFTHSLLPLNSSALYCKKCVGIFVPKETMRLSLKSIEEKISNKINEIRSS